MVNTGKKDEPAEAAGMVRAVLKGILTGIGITAVLTLLLSAVITPAKDPDRLIGWMAVGALLSGAFACGLAGTRADRGHSPLTGLVSGLLYVLLLWLLSLPFREEAGAVLTTILRYAGCAAAALAGGFAGRGARRSVGGGKNSPTAAIRRQLRRKS